jgi:hypothetical protein
VYFVIKTRRPLKKGEQIYNFYGGRSNHFLLMWYGFTLKENYYDYVPFRLKINVEYNTLCLQDEELMKEILIQNFVYGKEMRQGNASHNSKKISFSELTREFRLKKNKICSDLIVYLRIYLIQFYQGNDIGSLKVTIPVSL